MWSANRSLPHSNKQWRRVEVRVDKNTGKYMKLSIPTSLWCYFLNALKCNAGKVCSARIWIWGWGGGERNHLCDRCLSKNGRAPIILAWIYASSETQGLLAETMRYFRAKVYFKSWRAPGNLFFPNQFQKWSNSVPLIAQKNIFLANQRGRLAG